MTFDREKAQRDLNELMERDPREYSTAIGAGIVLTEHMQAALDEIARLRSDRENLAGRLNSAEAQIIQYDEYAARFRQDYEEQAKRIAELEIVLSQAQQIAILTTERDEAQKNYQWMVDNAANQNLDGYRELGQKAADAENECDKLRGRIAALKEIATKEKAQYAIMQRGLAGL